MFDNEGDPDLKLSFLVMSSNVEVLAQGPFSCSFSGGEECFSLPVLSQTFPPVKPVICHL